MARDRTRKQIRDEILDELLEGYDNPEDLLGKDGLLKQLRGRLVERVLDAELTDHLGYDKHDPDGYGTGNSRNGRRKKIVWNDRSPVYRRLAAGDMRCPAGRAT